MLSIKNLFASIDGAKILKGFNLEVKPGEIHAIMGPNGSGKSTLSSCIAGKENCEVNAGEIKFFSETLLEIPIHERALKGIFLAFQYPPEVPGVSNINFLKSAINSKRKHNNLDPISPNEFFEKFNAAKKMLSFDESLSMRFVNDGFSGGEKKKSEILQMLMLQPQLVILDEIDSGLDIDALKIISEGINKFHNSKNAIIIITHYNRILEYVKPDFIHIMNNGAIIKSGDSELAKELEAFGYSKWV